MELETITCNNCGAPLQVPAGAKFITCNHCQSNLAIHRNDSATYTEKIAQIEEHTQEMASDLAQLRYESELARVDREWERERESYLVRDKEGNSSEPSAVGSLIGGALATVFGLFWMGFTSSMPMAGSFSLFGLVFIGFGILVAIFGYSKANQFDAAKQRYLLRRGRLSATQFLHSGGHASEPATDRATEAVNAYLDRAQQAR